MHSGPHTASPAKTASFRARQMRMLAAQLFIGIAVASLPLAFTTDASARSVHHKKPAVARAAPASPHARPAHHRNNPSLRRSGGREHHQPQANKPNRSSCCPKHAKTKPPQVTHKPGGVIVRPPPVTVVPPLVSVWPPPAPAPSAVFLVRHSLVRLRRFGKVRAGATAACRPPVRPAMYRTRLSSKSIPNCHLVPSRLSRGVMR